MAEEESRYERWLIRIGVTIDILAVPLFIFSGMVVLSSLPMDFHPYLALMILGSSLIIVGLILRVQRQYPLRNKGALEKSSAYVSMAFLVSMILFVSVILNPIISPCPWAYDTDGDGITDAFDSYPHDPNASGGGMPHAMLIFNKSTLDSYWNLTVSFAMPNNYSISISDVYVKVRNATNSIIFRPLTEINGVWNDGIFYDDRDSNGRVNVGDEFLLDRALYPEGKLFELTDKWKEHEYGWEWL
jgi:hypothetical protein